MSLRKSTKRLVLAVFAMIVTASSLIDAAAAQAQFTSTGVPIVTQSQPGGGPQIVVPTTQVGNKRAAGYSRRSGLQLHVDLGWPGEYGYKPIRFRLVTASPAQAAQQITVRFQAGDWSSGGRSITVEGDGELAVGDSSTTITVVAPKYCNWQWVSWDVWVDGVKDDDLCVDRVFGGNVSSSLGALVVDDSNKRAAQLVSDLQQMTGGMPVSSRVAELEELPQTWLEYTALDVVVLNVDSLAELRHSMPQRLQALLSWVRSGGNLWITDVGGQWAELPNVERVIGVDGGDDQNESIDTAARGWIFPRLVNVEKEAVEGTIALWDLETAYTSEAASAAEEAATFNGRRRSNRPESANRRKDAVNAPTSNEWFAVRSYGLGAVVAFRGEVVDVGGKLDANQALSGGLRAAIDVVESTLLQPRLSWQWRHGNAPDYENVEFNNLLIPGVGLAPVGMFQVLITLFVICIGPVNYYLLKRAKKLPMLLVTVPAAAAAVTLMLFSYGLLTDGFATRVRARSFTSLNQRTGNQVSVNRLSYYAAVAPSEGLRFPTDVAIYPIHAPGAFSQMGRRGDPNEREVQWDADQWLRTGWMSSRTPTQFLTIDPSPTKKRLKIAKIENGLQVTNQLGVEIKHLAIQDEKAQFYSCSELAAGEQRSLTSQESDEVLIALRELLQENEPEFPPGSDQFTRRRGMYGFALSNGLLEAPIRALASPLIRELGDKVYVAITEEAIELDLGLPDVVEEAGFHVIRGQW